MLGTTTNGEHRKLIGVEIMSSFGYGIQILLSGVLPVSESSLRVTVVCIYLVYYPTNKVVKSMYVCRCTCVACGTLSIFHYNMYGTLSIFHYSIMWLSRWRYGEALRRDFLCTTKLESKFIIRLSGIPPRIGKGLYLA